MNTLLTILPSMNKYLQIIENPKDKELCEKVIELFKRFDTAITPIQIENFILNDIEFPTSYGKFTQCQLELASRFGQLIEIYYQIKENEIKIRQKERKIIETQDDLEKELLELQKEKLEMKILGSKRELKKILKEARVFFGFYEKHPEFHELSPEKAFKLEAEQWAKKTLNMPTVFEERYGKDYMIKALGKENYQKFLELRRKGFGLLPREIFEIKKLK